VAKAKRATASFTCAVAKVEYLVHSGGGGPRHPSGGQGSPGALRGRGTDDREGHEREANDEEVAMTPGWVKPNSRLTQGFEVR
jgi:hypothetical protein